MSCTPPPRRLCWFVFGHFAEGSHSGDGVEEQLCQAGQVDRAIHPVGRRPDEDWVSAVNELGSRVWLTLAHKYGETVAFDFTLSSFGDGTVLGIRCLSCSVHHTKRQMALDMLDAWELTIPCSTPPPRALSLSLSCLSIAPLCPHPRRLRAYVPGAKCRRLNTAIIHESMDQSGVSSKQDERLRTRRPRHPELQAEGVRHAGTGGVALRFFILFSRSRLVVLATCSSDVSSMLHRKRLQRFPVCA